MRNSASLQILPVVAVFILIVLGCGEERASSVRPGCLSPDGTKIGFNYGLRVMLISADTGDVLKQVERDRGGAAVCLENNKVIAVFPKLIQELTGEKQVERNNRTLPIVGAHGNDGMVQATSSGFTDETDSRPFSVYYENFGVIENEPKPFVFEPDRFPELLKYRPDYWAIPVRVLNDGDLLVGLGNAPSYETLSERGRQIRVSPEPWGFVLINPRTGEIKSYGPPKTQDSEIHFVTKPRFHATTDGSYAAIASWSSGNAVSVWAERGSREIFRRKMENAAEIRDVILSEDGSRVAVAVVYLDPEPDKIEVFDLRTDSTVNSFEPKDISVSSVEFISMKGDELILSAFDGKIAKFDTKTGSVKWLKQFGKDQ